MKRMIVAGVLALALTATARQEASAWCKFSWSAGFNISYESTGTCRTWSYSCIPNPPPCNYGCYPGCYGGPTMYPGYAYGYAPTPVAAPVAAPAAAIAAQPQTQQVGYTFYGQGYAPSYWYGN